MAIKVQRITIWRTEVDDRPGALAEVLEPLAATGADLQVVMGYRERGRNRAVIEAWPVAGRRRTEAAEGAGLRPSATPTLYVSGANRAGLGHRMARALADSGISVAFLVAQVVGRNYSAIFGFESEEDAARALRVLRSAARR